MKSKTIAIAIIFFLKGSLVIAQWSATSYIARKETILGLTDVPLNSRSPFQDEGNLQPIDCNEIDIIDSNLAKKTREYGFAINPSNSYHCALPLATKVKFKFAYFVFQPYVQNIGRCLILMKTSKNQWLGNEVAFEFQGLASSFRSYLSSWDSFGTMDIGSESFLDLTDIYIICESKVDSEDSSLLINKLLLEEYQSHFPGENHPWIKPLVLEQEDYSHLRMLYEYSNWSNEKLKGDSFPTFDEFGVEKGYLSDLVKFDCGGDDCDEQTFFKSFLMHYLAVYPYYFDKGLDSVQIKRRVSNFFLRNAKLNFPDFIDSVSKILNLEFADPHLEIILPSSMSNASDKKNDSPISLYSIGKTDVVSGVFNEELAVKVPIGSIFTKINDHKVGKSTDFDKERAKSMDDAIVVDAYYPLTRQSKKVEIKKKTPIHIPDNFRTKHGFFEFGADSIAYLRINRWLGDAVLHFLNNRESIIASKGLILDLRGNGGGYAEDVIKSLSLFLSKPGIIGKMNHEWLRESIIVSPVNSNMAFPSSLKVILLIDNMTACGSEIFLIGMKKRPNTFVIGESNTAGAIASPTIFVFPSGIVFKGHTKFRKFVFDPTVYTEGKGIAPDIVISRTHPQDLYPYNDKMKKIASTILKKF